MTSLPPLTRFIVEEALLVFTKLASSFPYLEPWIKSLQLLGEADVEGASTIALNAFNNGVSHEERKTVIDLISKVAFEGYIRGPRYEALLLTAAESGHSDCAYNVGNLITERATSPADHALAHRYFAKAAQYATDPSTKASALVNSAMVIRDGLLTGKPDWKRALEIYEEAADLNLAVGMFNAANVSCWLKDKGEFAYAARAVRWFNRLIARVEDGGSFVDIGGDEEVREVYLMAKSRLAGLHAKDQADPVDVGLILEEAARTPDPAEAAWLRNKAFEHRLRKTAVMAKPAAWENWLSVLTLLGWELDSEPERLHLGPRAVRSRLLKFKREKGVPLALAVIDIPDIEAADGALSFVHFAREIQGSYDGPLVTIGSRGLFTAITGPWGDSSYTVWLAIADDGKIEVVPVWAGATADDVAAQMERSAPIYSEHNTDDGNTIAILANALRAGMTIDGESFPTAIYVNVGVIFNSPVFTVEQAIELGCPAPVGEIESAIKGVEEYFESAHQKKLKYLGIS